MFCCWCSKQDFARLPSLASNSWISCFSLPSQGPGITGMCYHPWLGDDEFYLERGKMKKGLWEKVIILIIPYSERFCPWGYKHGWPYLTLDKWGWQPLISHIYSQPKQGHCVPCKVTRGLHCGVEWTTMNHERPCRIKRIRCPLVPMGGCDWLVWQGIESTPQG